MLLVGLLGFAPSGVPASDIAEDTVGAPGMHLDAPPARLTLADEEVVSLDAVRGWLEVGDVQRALSAAQRYVGHEAPRRERAAAYMLIGMLHREAGRTNLASEAFTMVRRAGGPLAPWGAYYEAEQDFRRGREQVAIDECAAYRRRWSKGQHAGDCTRLIALAQARLGRVDDARRSATAYDEDHRLGQISEQVELVLARSMVSRGEIAEPVVILKALAVTHGAPLTGRVAEETLAVLQSQGASDAELPDDREALVARALSLRDARRRDDAWALFDQVSALAADDRQLVEFVEDEGERFGWRTHRWDYLADYYDAQYDATGDPRAAWSRYRVMVRGGLHDAAADLALTMQRKHGSSREWRHSYEDVGRTMMLAGRYAEARDQFDVVAATGGWTGRRGRFYAAFASLMGGDLKKATARLSSIVAGDPSWQVEARYWRARALALQDRAEAAELDLTWVVDHDPESWYAVLVRQQRPDTPVMAPFARTGTWAGFPVDPTIPAPGPTRPPDPTPRSVPVSRPHVPPARSAPRGLAAVAWPWARPFSLPEAPRGVTAFDPERRPPPGYRAGELWNPDEGRVALARFAGKWDRYWPELAAINDLASVGLYDLSGPLMSTWYEDWRRDYRRRRRTARRIRGMETEDWRTLFLAARDHHHAARFSYDLWEDLPDAGDAVREEAWRLAYPLAHDHVVWEASRAHDIDPFLVLGLMRQESTYQATAVSRVGARGAMQIMPRTGHLLADLAHDIDFTAGDLEDPILSVQYGIRYLGLLMRRFEGAFPLAVASYNGGPFNVSSWLSGTGQDIPMDAFVEHIPFRETRDYVKRVTAGYAMYVELYGPEGSRVVIPPHPRGDHPEVVDF